MMSCPILPLARTTAAITIISTFLSTLTTGADVLIILKGKAMFHPIPQERLAPNQQVSCIIVYCDTLKES